MVQMHCPVEYLKEHKYLDSIMCFADYPWGDWEQAANNNVQAERNRILLIGKLLIVFISYGFTVMSRAKMRH